MNYMDAEAVKTMMKTSGDVIAITNEEPSDPSKFIIPIVGPINNWTWVGFSENVGKKFCNASSNVLFNIFVQKLLSFEKLPTELPEIWIPTRCQ